MTCAICMGTGKICKYGRIEVPCDECGGNFAPKIPEVPIQHKPIDKVVEIVRKRRRQKSVITP